MAQIIRLKHPQSGVVKSGFYGFSWTTLFFSGFAAIFRGDLITGVIVLVLNVWLPLIVVDIGAFLSNGFISLATLFLSAFPPAFRGDLITDVISNAIEFMFSTLSCFIVLIIWASLYNHLYTTRLLKQGYVFDDAPEKVEKAKRALGIG